MSTYQIQTTQQKLKLTTKSKLQLNTTLIQDGEVNMKSETPTENIKST